MSSKYPGVNPETAFCSGVRWSLVISVTDGRESTRLPWRGPPASRAEAEGGETGGGRDDPAATVFERRRPAPVPVWAVFDDDLAGGVVALVGGREPADVLAGHAEGGVGDTDWLAEPPGGG